MSAPKSAAASGAEPTGALTGTITVLLTLAGWSSVPLFLKYFAGHIDAWTSNGWRYGFAALIWLPVVLVASRRDGVGRRLWAAALVPALINSVGQVCFTWAHYKIDPGLLTFGLRTQIVFVALGAYLLFPTERAILRSPRFWVGLVMVAAGTVGTVLGGGSLDVQGVWGVLLAVASGAFFAAYALSVRYYMQGFRSVVAFAAISQYTAVAMVVLMLALGDNAGAGALELTAGQFWMLLLSSIIGIALGHVFYYISIARLGVAVTSGVIQLQPFGVAAASMVLFGERLTPKQWAFGLTAVAGAIIMLDAQRRISRTARRRRAADAEQAATDAARAERENAERRQASV